MTKLTRTYGGVIWTHHALKRLGERRIPQESAWRAFRHPQETKRAHGNGTSEFVKVINDRTITVIAKQNDRREWIIMSCWAKPPFPGSLDLQPQSHRASLLAWITSIVRRALGM